MQPSQQRSDLALAPPAHGPAKRSSRHTRHGRGCPFSVERWTGRSCALFCAVAVAAVERCVSAVDAHQPGPSHTRSLHALASSAAAPQAPPGTVASLTEEAGGTKGGGSLPADVMSSLFSHPSLLVALVVLVGLAVAYGADAYVFLFDRERYHQLVRERREYVEETERREKKVRLDEQSPLISSGGGTSANASAQL